VINAVWDCSWVSVDTEEDFTNATATCILGSIEPLANWFSAICFSASETVKVSSRFCSGLPKLTATFSMAVKMYSTVLSTVASSRKFF
jgi:hypothetical protein